MTDRSEIMRRVHRDGTRPEMIARTVARLSGIPFRVNARDLPGSPDIVFDSERLAVFVHGCFWHRHTGCERGRRTPRIHHAFWEHKFELNVRRDRRAVRRLEDLGWRVEILWECEL